MAPRGALIAAASWLSLAATAHAHNLVGCESFCYDDSGDPQFALQLRHLATGLISFEVCDIAPLSGQGEWNGPCANALFVGATDPGELDGELTLHTDCGESIATVTSTCFALKDLLIESSDPASTVVASLNLMVGSAASCEFFGASGITIAYRIDEMTTGTNFVVDHLHAALGTSSQLVTTVPIELPVGRDLRVSISAGISGTAHFHETTDCVSRWTVTLPESGPVMNLPQDATLTSVQGSIVDNRWLPCPADLDGSDAVDVVDLLQLLTSWGTHGPGAAIAEPDSIADVADLLALLAGWGPC